MNTNWWMELAIFLRKCRYKIVMISNRYEWLSTLVCMFLICRTGEAAQSLLPKIQAGNGINVLG